MQIDYFQKSIFMKRAFQVTKSILENIVRKRERDKDGENLIKTHLLSSLK